MCAIVDANKFGDFMSRNPNEAAEQFQNWMRGESGGILVYPEIPPPDKGKHGKELPDKKTREDMRQLIGEYRRSPNMLTLLEQYSVMGRARRVKLSEVAKMHPETAQARSNDRHILALALASGARLLYTGDKQLKHDFQNPQIIGNPPGEVYASAADKNLLRPDICENC